MTFPYVPQFARAANLGWTDAAMTAMTVVSANVKTAWVQVSAAAPFDADSLIVAMRNRGSNFQTMWMDVGIGGAGAEIVIVSNWPTQAWSFANTPNFSSMPIPVRIKAGQRVAIRAQSNNADAGGNLGGALGIFSGGFAKIGPFTALDVDIGKDMANSRGTSVTPGTSAEGAWTELEAALAKDIKGFFVHQTNGANDDAEGRFEIGVGGSGSEVALTPYLAYRQQQANPPLGWMSSGPSFFPLSAGTRIAARARAGAAQAIRVSLTGLRG